MSKRPSKPPIPPKVDVPVPPRQLTTRKDWDKYIAGIMNRFKKATRETRDKKAFSNMSISATTSPFAEKRPC